MSYQFEDDSALEELLNQQLDRRKQPTNINQNVSNRSSTAKSLQRSSNVPAATSSRPSTALGGPTNVEKLSSQPPSATTSTITAPKSKLASWLDGSPSSKLPEQDAATTLEAQEPVRRSETSVSAIGQQLLEETLNEEQLQEMSKQRLIKLITGEIIPAMKSLRKLSSEQSEAMVLKLKDELQLERNKFNSMELRHLDQQKLAESRWSQLNKQLESRLELNEQELILTVERHRTLIVDLEEDYKQQIDKLKENYQAKLSDEKLQFEETLKRRENLHNLELESKLKVNCDLVKLETVFDEWHKMIQTTIKELDLQFKSVESLLDKQTIEINGTNSELAKKSKDLSEHYEKFESKTEQFGCLAENLNKILPSFSRIQEENESLARQTSAQLEEFLLRNDQLRTREKELNRLKDELAGDKAKLSEERFGLALSSNRIAYKEERLAEMVQSNEAQELMLAKQKRDQMDHDARLVALQTSLDIKSNELKQQNYDLHLTRKKLINETERIKKLELELEGERISVQNQLNLIQTEAQKLSVLRDRAKKELNQLRRLQKSLVCSLCIDRLFKGPENQLNLQLTSHNKWVPNSDILKELESSVDRTSIPSKKETHIKASSKSQLNGWNNFEEELAKLNRYIEMDSKQLEVENQYVELLSAR